MPLLEDIYALQRAKKVEIVPFFYSASFQNSAVAFSTTASQNVPIQADSNFVCRYINYTAYTGTVILTTSPALLMNLFDTGSGRTLQDNPQPIQNLAGGQAAGGAAGMLPFILPEPWLIKAGGVIQIQITNLSATLTVGRLDVSLVGFKVFSFGNNTPGSF